MNKSDAYSATTGHVELNVDPSSKAEGESRDPGEITEIRDIKEAGMDREKPDYTAAQKEVADRAHAMIVENLERHITIAEFAQALHASPTQVKVSFHKVYGMPIYTYARSRRMEAASKLLLETDESVLEIAGKFGYENGSKFAGAFRTVMGVSPSEYRKRALWEIENQAYLNAQKQQDAESGA